MFFNQDELTCIHQHSHTFPYLPGYSSVEDCVLDPLVGCTDEDVKIVSCLNDYSDPVRVFSICMEDSDLSCFHGDVNSIT